MDLDLRDNIGAVLIGAGFFAIPAIAVALIAPESPYLQLGVVALGAVLGTIGTLLRQTGGVVPAIGATAVVVAVIIVLAQELLTSWLSSKFGFLGLVVVALVLGWYVARENARVDQ